MVSFLGGKRLTSGGVWLTRNAGMDYEAVTRSARSPSLRSPGSYKRDRAGTGKAGGNYTANKANRRARRLSGDHTDQYEQDWSGRRR